MKNILRYSLVAVLLAVFGVSHATDVKFDFINNGLSLFGLTAGSTNSSTDGDITEAKSATLNGITMTISPAEKGTANRFWTWTQDEVSGVQLRIYSGTLTLKSSEPITKIEFEQPTPASTQKWTDPSPSTGTISGQTWSGSATELTFTFTGQCRINGITVTTNGEGSGEVTPVDPQPTSSNIVFDFDNKADELFPSMAGKRSSGSNDSYVADGEFTTDLTSTPVNGATVTISASGEDRNTKNRLWTSSPVLRMYDGTLTVKADKNIKTITFTLANSNSKFGDGSNTASVGTLKGTDGDKEAVWTGDASEVVFTIAKNSQIRSIALGFDEKAPELVISGVTPFEGSTTVTITGGNSIYYTLDGSDPATNETAPLYTGPFTLTESATVRAWDEVLNISAEKTFTKKETPVVNSIAEFIALAKGDKAVLNLTDAVCLYTWTSNAESPNTLAYVRDASGALNFFNTGITMREGDVLNGSIILQKDEYNGLPEAIKAGSMTEYGNLLVNSGSAPEARSIVITNVGNYLNDLVELQNVSITTEEGTTPGGGGSEEPTPTQGDITFDIDNNYAALFPTLAGTSSNDSNDGDFTAATTSTAVSGATITVSAANEGVRNANRIWSASPRLRMYSGTLTVTAPAGKTVTGITFTLHNQKSNAKWGANNTANTGNVALDEAGTSATWTGSANEVVFTIAANTQIKSIALTLAGSSSAAAPRRAAAKYYAKDAEGNTVQIYNNYHIADFDDYSKYVNDKKYTVKGIVTVYNTTYEINTTEITEIDATGIHAVAAERLDVTAPIYNLAGQQVSKAFKGVVIQNGKKYILK